MWYTKRLKSAKFDLVCGMVLMVLNEDRHV